MTWGIQVASAMASRAEGADWGASSGSREVEEHQG